MGECGFFRRQLVVCATKPFCGKDGWLGEEDPLHGVQAQNFSNAFSNAGDSVRLRPGAHGLRAQYSNHLRSPADAGELKKTAMACKGSGVRIPLPPPKVCYSNCESSGPLSHFGSGTCVSLSGPASVHLSRWLRDVCLTASTFLTRCDSGSGRVSSVRGGRIGG
jgi:hypothetical protein